MLLVLGYDTALRAGQHRKRGSGSRDKKLRIMEKNGIREMGVLIGKIRLTYDNTCAKNKELATQLKFVTICNNTTEQKYH